MKQTKKNGNFFKVMVLMWVAGSKLMWREREREMFGDRNEHAYKNSNNSDTLTHPPGRQHTEPITARF